MSTMSKFRDGDKVEILADGIIGTVYGMPMNSSKVLVEVPSRMNCLYADHELESVLDRPVRGYSLKDFENYSDSNLVKLQAQAAIRADAKTVLSLSGEMI